MELVHWKADPGRALCTEALGVAASPAMPGEILVLDRRQVTCSECIEWLHG